jgi:hypothetical protein
LENFGKQSIRWAETIGVVSPFLFGIDKKIIRGV